MPNIPNTVNTMRERVEPNDSDVERCQPRFKCNLCVLGYTGEQCDICGVDEEFSGSYGWYSYTSTLSFSGNDCTQFTGKTFLILSLICFFCYFYLL